MPVENLIRYSETEHAELVARLATLEQERAGIATECNDMQASDTDWSEPRLHRYSALAVQEQRIGNEIDHIRARAREMQLMRPLPRHDPRRNSVLARFFRGGHNALEADERVAIQTSIDRAPLGISPGGQEIRVGPGGISHTRDVQGLLRRDDASGDDFVPTEHRNEPIDRLSAFGGVMQAAQIWETETGNNIEQTVIDAITQKGRQITGDTGSQAAELDTPNPNNVTIGAYIFTSDIVPISQALIQDAGFDIVSYIISQCVRRLGRILNERFTTGTGVGQPQGVAIIAKDGEALDGPDTVTFADLSDLIYDVDDAYVRGTEEAPGPAIAGRSGGMMAERGGGIGYMLSRSVEGAIRKAEADGRPVWQPAIAGGLPDRINGFPYWINYDLDSLGAAAKTVGLFGNFSYFIARMVQDMSIHTFFDSGTAASYARHVIAFIRADARALAPIVGGRCEAIARLSTP